MISYWYHKCKQ